MTNFEKAFRDMDNGFDKNQIVEELIMHGLFSCDADCNHFDGCRTNDCCIDGFTKWAFAEVGDEKNLCEFCEMLDYMKTLAAKDVDIKHVYAVKIVDEMYVNGNFRGQSTYGSMPLNFCPMCGKKLEDDDETEAET